MKLLIVASYNKNRFAPFIVEQAEAIAKIGVEVDYFGVTGKGIKGYLGNLGRLKQKIKEFRKNRTYQRILVIIDSIIVYSTVNSVKKHLCCMHKCLF